MPQPAAPRIALIHALMHSVAPINQALAQAWPQALRMNLIDDSLSSDLAASAQGLDAAMHQRFQDLAHYAVGNGCEAILFTCSAFGPCIEAVARRHPGMPVHKPNEAMVEDATALGCPVGLLATFGPTLVSLPGEFAPQVELHSALVADAMAALNAGDTQRHDELIADAAQALARRHPCGVIALAQFSMARAAALVAQRTGLPVLTTVDSAVKKLRRQLNAPA